MIKHIVMWKIKESHLNEKEAVIKNIKAKLDALPGTIAEIKSLEVGVNYNDSAAAYDVALYSEFASKSDLDAYQIHPVHKEAAIYIGSVVDERAVVDYEV